jgi:hypothetical protein
MASSPSPGVNASIPPLAIPAASRLAWRSVSAVDACGRNRSPASTTTVASASARVRAVTVARRASPPSGCTAQSQGAYLPCRFDE